MTSTNQKIEHHLSVAVHRSKSLIPAIDIVNVTATATVIEDVDDARNGGAVASAGMHTNVTKNTASEGRIMRDGMNR